MHNRGASGGLAGACLKTPKSENRQTSANIQSASHTEILTLPEYLLSVRVERPAWESIDFHGLKSIDVNESLAQFDLKRDQLKDGSFRAIIPHKVGEGGS